MAECPECKAQIVDGEERCPLCGAKMIPADSLERIATKTSTWQKVVIAVSVIILIAIAFTFDDAEKRENAATEQNIALPLTRQIRAYIARTAVARQYGVPVVNISALTKTADVTIEFPRGPLAQQQASGLARIVAATLAKTYVEKGYIARRLSVWISSTLPGGKQYVYGRAIYDGNTDKLEWQQVEHN